MRPYFPFTELQTASETGRWLLCGSQLMMAGMRLPYLNLLHQLHGLLTLYELAVTMETGKNMRVLLTSFHLIYIYFFLLFVLRH